MKSALAGTLERARSTFSTISLGQKVVIGLLLVGLLLGGFFFFRWITAPTQAPLFSNLASADASAIVDELNAGGVAYTLADGGQTIMVDKDQVYDLRLQMSGKGLPAGQDTGYALLDKQGITTSEFQQQVTYQRALEGELSNTLEALDGVNQAVVHVALPKDEVFVTEQAKPTASVLLDLAPGTKLSGEQIQAVTNLVSSSVQDMDPDQVTVTDSTGHVLSAPGTGITAGAGDARSQVEQEYEARLAANAQQILDTVVGPGHAKVSVRADVDLSQAAVDVGDLHLHRRHAAALLEHDHRELQRRRHPGRRRPRPGEHARRGDQRRRRDSTYDKESTTDNNAVDKTTETVEAAPGALNRLTVSVVMDDAVAGSLNQQQIQRPRRQRRRPGHRARRRDHRRLDAVRHHGRRAGRRGHGGGPAAEASAQMWSMIRTGGIAAGIALVVLLVWLRSRRQEEIEEEYEPLELTDDMLAELDRLRVAEHPRGAAQDRQPAALELEAAERQKVRGEISTMVSERPDEVAAMLRGWLSENKA